MAGMTADHVDQNRNRGRIVKSDPFFMNLLVGSATQRQKSHPTFRKITRNRREKASILEKVHDHSLRGAGNIMWMLRTSSLEATWSSIG